jgi:hypothetical protein
MYGSNNTKCHYRGDGIKTQKCAALFMRSLKWTNLLFVEMNRPAELCISWTTTWKFNNRVFKVCKKHGNGMTHAYTEWSLISQNLTVDLMEI